MAWRDGLTPRLGRCTGTLRQATCCSSGGVPVACAGMLRMGRLRAKARLLQRAGPSTQRFAVPCLLGYLSAAAWSLCTELARSFATRSHYAVGMKLIR